MGRAAPSTATSCATTAPPWVMVARRVETLAPRRRGSTVISARPGSTGAGISPVTERTRRAGSGSARLTARSIAPRTSPPKAPRPCAQPSGTSSA
ncbi:MAG: hypothetical protein U0325_12200 [Polyangiales bacterium]